MKTTTLNDFRRELRETGAYATHDDCVAAKRAKMGFWTTLRYSWGVMRVFPLSAWAENFSTYDTERFAGFCFSAITTPAALGMRVKIEGFQARQQYSGPVVYLCNHMSMTETILLMPILLALSPLNYVAKASLAHLPGLVKAAAHMGMVPISRTSPRQDLINILRTGEERLKAGNSFLIFPQGTRCEVFSHGKFSSIGAKLAEKAVCPVVPLVVDTRCQPTRKTGMWKKVLKDFGPVNTAFDIRVAAGPVIPNAKSKVMHEAAFDWMATKLEEWGLPTER